jgi:uncharacterized membrane protein
MIQLHTSHGWLRPDARVGTAWNAAQFFGGLAAPIFLTLAGMSLGIQWGRAAHSDRPLSLAEHSARALQVVVLGYALRLQMWVIDAGAYARPANYLIVALLAAAYALFYAAAAQLPVSARRAVGYACAALAAWVVGICVLRWVEPTRIRNLVRVDVLQCIGASLLLLNVLALVCGKRPPPRSALLIVAWFTGLATPWLRAHVPGPLPEAIAGYLGQWPDPNDKPVLALFPLFPWFGYACGGAALGLHWTHARSPAALQVRLIASVALGAWLAMLTSEARPGVYAFTREHEAVAAALRLSYKLGLVMLLMGAAIAIARAPAWLARPVQLLGRCSLLVYWVHLEFAFGTAARPVVRKLDWLPWTLGTLALIAAMWCVAAIRAGTSEGTLRWPRRRTVIS